MLVPVVRVRCIARNARWNTFNCCALVFVTTTPSDVVTACTGVAAVTVLDLDVVACAGVVVVERVGTRTAAEPLTAVPLFAAVVAVVAVVAVDPVADTTGCAAPTEATVGDIDTAVVSGAGAVAITAGFSVCVPPAPT